MKKLLCLILACMLSVSMAACAKGGAGGADASSAGAKGVKEIAFWYQDNPLMTGPIQKRVDTFNEKYKNQYHVTVTFIPRGTAYAYEDKVNTAASAGLLPDLISLDGPNVANYAENGIIVPIDKYVSEQSKADIMPSMLLQNTYGGKMYALGLNEATCGLFYNKDVFKANGFRIPKSIDDAYTWTELYQMAKKVATPQMAGIKLIMNKGEGLPYALTPFWIANGTAFTSEDGSTAKGYINSPKGVEAAKYLQRFFTEKLANIDPSPTEFQDGKAAMWVANAGEIAGFLKSYPKLNWGVTYMPRPDNGKVSAPCGSWTVGISKNCKSPDDAAIALDFLTNAESTRLYMDQGGYPGARRSNYENNQKWNSAPYNVFTEELFKAAVPRPRTPVYTVLSPKFSETILDVFSGADAKESLDSLAEYVDAEYVRFINSKKSSK